MIHPILLRRAAALLLILGFGASAPAAPDPAFKVCLDPGHPSERNDGRELLHGLREVEINWTMAQALRVLLEEKGYAVALTKGAPDEYVTNKRRAEIANAMKADLMLRLHADSEGPGGLTLYYPRRAGRAQGVTGPSPEMIAASGRAARAFQAACARELAGELRDNGVRGDEQTFIGARQGALTGSIHSRVPTLLVEMCNLAKGADANWIRQKANQQKLARALLAGVVAVAAEASQAASGR